MTTHKEQQKRRQAKKDELIKSYFRIVDRFTLYTNLGKQGKAQHAQRMLGNIRACFRHHEDFQKKIREGLLERGYRIDTDTGAETVEKE